MPTLLFDLGNVLIDFDHRVVAQQLVRYFPEDRQTATLQAELHQFIFGGDDPTSPNVALDRGTQDLDDLRYAIRDRFGVEVPQSDFAEIWPSIFADRLNADAFNCVKRYCESGLNVAICSNTNPAHWNPLLAMHPELRELTEQMTCFLSYEIGKQKADAGFFDTIVNTTKSERGHHVLIDDLEANCKAAESAGLHAVLFQPKNPRESIRQIDALVTQQRWAEPCA